MESAISGVVPLREVISQSPPKPCGNLWYFTDSQIYPFRERNLEKRYIKPLEKVVQPVWLESLNTWIVLKQGQGHVFTFKRLSERIYCRHLLSLCRN